MSVKPSFYDRYGQAIGKPVNAVLYELTDGGDAVRGLDKAWLIPAIKAMVHDTLRQFRDTDHIRFSQISREVDEWIEVNERKGQ